MAKLIMSADKRSKGAGRTKLASPTRELSYQRFWKDKTCLTDEEAVLPKVLEGQNQFDQRGSGPTKGAGRTKPASPTRELSYQRC
ncbi:hypothetical protein [Bacillus salipaludis]|uniref:hypothetical protein n=1 Tax=Bacillus salipaludis TaxID=2547811 RepID=UPI002E23C598|nr:hypothetical protein [Bacillus salipaludis]